METKKRPVKKFRAGAVSVSIWSNDVEGKDTTFNTISLDRVYKDKEGEWQNSGSFRVNDLPKAMVVLNKAYEYLLTSKPKAEAEE